MGSLRPSFCSISRTAARVGLRPTYWVASWYVFWPASRGIRKKTAYVTMLTTISRKTVAIRRRMMKVTTVGGAGARPGFPAGHQCLHLLSCAGVVTASCALLQAQHRVVVHAVVRLHVHVGEVRATVEQRLGVHLRQDASVLHDLHVDLAGV